MSLSRKYQEMLQPGSYDMVCMDCSSVVYDIEKHDDWHKKQDDWHKKQDLTERYLAYIRGDGPFPGEIAEDQKSGTIDDSEQMSLP